ncbi:MAG: hypothetical protein IJE04_03515 [Bacilli bacterium]|nr:hypothetical protein [Bacilli bacterium]
MVEVLKKIDKKILIIICAILLLPIVLIIFLAIIQGCSNSNITHEKYEEKMIEAAQKYFEDNDNMPKEESEAKTVELSTIVNKKYIKSAEELVGDGSCKGSVTVRRNGVVIEENDGGYLNYTVNLECDTYQTNTLINNLMKDVVSQGSGLYQDNNYYVYKGDEVNNYITFYGVDYRIININENRMIKLLKVESELLDRFWDNKYNVEVSDLYGKNIYADSAILKNIILDYNNTKIIAPEAKKRIISTDVCIDSRDINNVAISDYVCSNKLENQVISLIDVSDFAKASLDLDCTTIYSRSCGNYNYLKELNLRTWTPTSVSNNTYQVYYLTNGIIKIQEASKYENYNLVIHIDGNEKIVSGKGTKTEPYVVK